MATPGTLFFSATRQSHERYTASFKYVGEQLPRVVHKETLSEIYPTACAGEEAADVAGREWLEKNHPCNPAFS